MGKGEREKKRWRREEGYKGNIRIHTIYLINYLSITFYREKERKEKTFHHFIIIIISILSS